MLPAIPGGQRRLCKNIKPFRGEQSVAILVPRPRTFHGAKELRETFESVPVLYG